MSKRVEGVQGILGSPALADASQRHRKASTTRLQWLMGVKGLIPLQDASERLLGVS